MQNVQSDVDPLADESWLGTSTLAHVGTPSFNVNSGTIDTNYLTALKDEYAKHILAMGKD
jgi:hypothetical protein